MISIRLRAVLIAATAGVALSTGLVAPAGATAPAAAGSGHHVLVVSACGKATFKPSSYVLTCADDNTRIAHAKYSAKRGLAWGDADVLGHGRFVYNDCTPSCVQGTFHHHPVTFYLSRVRSAHGQKVYTRLQATYAGLSETFDLAP